ncbi:hypothetical protein Tco_0833226 [Tanacetum coccineum]
MLGGADHGFTMKGLDKAEIVRILAGQLIRVAAMADASSLLIVSLSQPHGDGLQGRPAQRELLKHRDYEVDLDCCLGKTQNREDYFNICKMLYAASVTGDWEAAKNILDRHTKRYTLSSCSDSEEQQMQQIQDKAKKSCMVSFRKLHSHLKLLSNNDFKGTRTECGFKRAFASLFGQDVETFTSIMFLNMDQLEKQLDNEEFQEIRSMAAFIVLETQF